MNNTPTFQTWKVSDGRGGWTQYLAIPWQDGVSIIDDCGRAYGTWMSKDSFMGYVADRKREGSHPMHVGKAYLSMRIDDYDYMRQNASDRNFGEPAPKFNEGMNEEQV